MTKLQLAITLGILGLLVGSFLNVLIHRVPRKLPWAVERSRCPKCNMPISAFDNVPILSWIVLRGKCRQCREWISLRYPAVELVTAVVFAAMALRFGFDWVLPAYLVFAAGMVVLCAIDLEFFLLPNRVLYPTLWAVMALMGLSVIGPGDTSDFVRALVGGFGAFLFFFFVHFAYPAGMGFGDVRLSFILGMVTARLGYDHVFLGFFLSFVAGAIIPILVIAISNQTVMVFSKKLRKARIPFGPFLVGGCLTAILWGRPILDWYLGTPA